MKKPHKFINICAYFFILICCNLISSCNSGNSNPTEATPTINSNAFNFIFVPSFESNPVTNNLSIQGLNHSLLFGQLLYQITANKINAIYALDPFADTINSIPDFKPIQSIENYALLNGFGITANISKDPTMVENLIATVFENGSYGVILNGNYVFALPIPLINAILQDLSIYNNYALKFTYTPLTNNHQYLILSILDMANISATTYNDGIIANNNYPDLNLTADAPCIESSIVINTSTLPPLNINHDETVYFVRHVEAHPGEDSHDSHQFWGFDDGNYVCQGQWRALASSNILLDKLDGKLPDYVYSSDPGEMYIESFPFTYVRPALTISPFTIKYGIPLNLVAANNFTWNQPESLATYFFTNNKFSNKTLLVAWEHGGIDKAVKFLFKGVYNDTSAEAQLPHWVSTDYDTIWKLELDGNGDAKFSNSCEGIATVSLPMSCPKF